MCAPDGVHASHVFGGAVVSVTDLHASLEAAEAALTIASKARDQARTALQEGIRDDWIARARIARPLERGEIEGWIESVGISFGAPPQIGYSTVKGRIVARAVFTTTNIEVTSHRQIRRADEGVGNDGSSVSRYQLRTREGRAWAHRFGVVR